MSFRSTAGAGDKARFVRTAQHTKRVNIRPKIMRGGIRF